VETRLSREEQTKRDEEAREEQRKRDEEAREEQRKRDEEQRMYLQSLIQGSSPCASPTPSTLGKEQHDTMVRTNRWKHLDGSGDAVLSDDQVSALPSSTCTEAELIQGFTPHLSKLVQQASVKIGSPLVLVNSERHAWVKDPSPVGAPSKPDMFMCHPAFFEPNKTQSDSKHDGKDFLFGACAHWDLRDCIDVIVEWKCRIGQDDFSALGEGVEYARRISHMVQSRVVPLDEPMVLITRLILADRTTFYLVLCQNGNATECLWGEWTQCGSVAAIVDFISDGASQTRWVSVLSSLCKEFGVELVNPSQGKPCFLGRGSCGRVFRVKKPDDNVEFALKVVLDDTYCSQLHEEVSKYHAHKLNLDKLECVVSIIAHHASSDRTFAGLLVGQVGIQCKRTKKDITAAVCGLKKLAKAGFRHGDARLPNVVMQGEKAVWLDLRTLDVVEQTGVKTQIEAFRMDLNTFVKSIDGAGKVSDNMLGQQVDVFFEDDGGDSDHPLIRQMSALWEQ
jgi:hypothetical protein